MDSALLTDRSHRRWNPLLREWVLVSPHRTSRPWTGAVETVAPEHRPAYDPGCYLCPGNARAGGNRNPQYTSIYIFDNDFPALSPVQGDDHVREAGLLRSHPASGECRVICFSPRHDLTLAELDESSVASVIRAWGSEYARLADNPRIRHVMIFENKGQMMGASNPHPHGQIWATDYVPNLPERSIAAQEDHFAAGRTSLLLDYARRELDSGERVVFQNESWLAVVPFWAVWPFETMILPKQRVQRITELDETAISQWSRAILAVTRAYDRLFQISFPYSMGVFQLPLNAGAREGFQLHQIFYPPLLRSATIKKFMVGFELCAEAQRDITAETAAQRLRELVE